MRRSAEWLLLPLFLLPFAAGIGLHLWAQADYDQRLEAVRRSGEATLRRMLSEDERRGGQARRAALEAATARIGLVTSVGRRDAVAFEVDGRRAWLRAAWPAQVSRPPGRWIGTALFPAGPTPEALADPGVRLALQTEGPPPQGVPEDPVSQAFRTLLEEPRPWLLRRTPLPAATKRYLVRRWRRMGVTIPQLAPLEELLDTLVQVEPLLLAERRAFPPGQHLRGGYQVSSAPPSDPVLSRGAPPPPHPFDPQRPPSWARMSDADGWVQAAYLGLTTCEPGPWVLWQGRIEAPVAGNWILWPTHGRSYGAVPHYARWRGPVVAVLLAFLLLPTALWISLRRRRRLDEARVRFINEMAHDLRTPLTSLRLHAEMLERGGGDPERTADYAQRIGRESTRMTGLLANLLDLSRLEDGRGRLQIRRVPLGPLVAAAVGDFQLLHPERGADVHVDGPPATVVRADPQALGRCLANVLDNAGKYANRGGAIHVTWEEAETEVVIRIADEGPGLPAEERRRAFDRYERGSRAQRDGLPGSGLGLSLVKDLLTELQGSVRWVASKTGTTIEMRVPRGGDE